MTLFYLYKITNDTNGKVYIGMTCRPKVRWREHQSKHSTCTRLRYSIAKHGAECFTFQILCIGSEEYIIELEEKAIVAYDSLINGYNSVLGNPRTGAMLLSDEMKGKISDGLNKYHSENVAWNKGIVIGLRKPYDPHYCCGFWFPHLEIAPKALGMVTMALRRRKREGTLGDVEYAKKKNSKDVPTYMAGFWFDTLSRACWCLNQERDAMLARQYRNSLEQQQKPKGQSGEDCHMLGRTGALHHNSKAVEVEGVIYGSLAEAGRESDYTRKMISTRIRNNIPGFAWVNQEF